MRKLYTFLILIFAFTFAQAQNDIKARIEFEEAEKAFTEENYETAIKHLNQTEKELGRWTPNVSYLKIESLYAVTDMGNFGAPTMQPLYEEVTQYMAYLNKLKSDDVPMEKYKVVYGIEKTLKALKLEERQSPEFLKAKKEHDAKNYDVAIQLWEKLAQKNNSWAMRNLGVVYETKKDNEKAKEWYLKALEKGNGDAALKLAEIDKDNTQKYYEKSAQLGHPHGIYALGWYTNKDGNVTRSMEYYQQAVDLGSADGLFGLAVLYYNNKENEKAISHFKKSQLKGNLAAIFNLGVIYCNGDRVPKSPQVGIEYYNKAAKGGYLNAMKNLGEIYEEGLYDVPRDHEKAAYWYEKMSDIDKGLGYEKLGDLYRRKQPKKALEYYEGAMNAGQLRSKYLVAHIYFSGEGGITKDYAKAIKYYEEYYTSEKKNDSYIDNLIEMYNRGGNGIEKDKEKAKYWKDIRRKQ